MASADLGLFPKGTLFPHRVEGAGEPSGVSFIMTLKVKVVAVSPTPCDPMVYTVCGTLQARMLEWMAIPFSRESSQPRNRTQVSHIAGGFFTQLRSPRILACVAYHFSIRSSQSKNLTGVSCIAGEFFIYWATRKLKEIDPLKKSPPLRPNSQRYLLQIPSPWELELKYLNFEVTQEHKHSAYNNHQIEQIWDMLCSKQEYLKTETVPYSCNGKTTRPGDGMFQGLASAISYGTS